MLPAASCCSPGPPCQEAGNLGHKPRGSSSAVLQSRESQSAQWPCWGLCSGSCSAGGRSSFKSSLECSTLWVFTTLLHCNRSTEVVAQGAILGIPTSWETEVACSATPTLLQPWHQDSHATGNTASVEGVRSRQNRPRLHHTAKRSQKPGGLWALGTFPSLPGLLSNRHRIGHSAKGLPGA